MGAAADDLIDGFVAGGEAELVEDFCAPLAVNVGAQLLGLDDVPRADLRRWFQHTACHFMVETPSSLRQKAAEINEEIDIVLTRRFRRLAEEADSSLLSSLVCGHGDAPGLTEEEAVANTKVLLFTSMQELRTWSGTLCSRFSVIRNSLPRSARTGRSSRRLSRRQHDGRPRWEWFRD